MISRPKRIRVRGMGACKPGRQDRIPAGAQGAGPLSVSGWHRRLWIDEHRVVFERESSLGTLWDQEQCTHQEKVLHVDMCFFDM
jgi:hypothetical protein